MLSFSEIPFFKNLEISHLNHIGIDDVCLRKEDVLDLMPVEDGRQLELLQIVVEQLRHHVHVLLLHWTQARRRGFLKIFEN